MSRRETYQVILNPAKYPARAALDAADVELARICKPLSIRHLRTERLEVAVDVADRLGRVAVGVEAEALGETSAVRTLDGLAQSLNGREDLRGEVVLVI